MPVNPFLKMILEKFFNLAGRLQPNEQNCLTLSQKYTSMRLLIPVIFLIAFCFPQAVFSQKIMQLEKAGSAKTRKFILGEEITFRKGDDKEWQKATIADIIPKDSIIVLDRQYVKLSEITAIRTFRNRGWSKAGAISLYTFGTAWAGFTLGDELADSKNQADWELAGYVAASSFASGFLLQQLFKNETYKMGKQHRLRLLDLTLQKD